MNQDEASTSADGKAPPRKNDAKGALPLSVSSHDPAADAVRASLTAGLFRLMENDPLARRGDAEGVHQMRTAARRLRAELRAFGPLLETAWNEALDRELRWLGKMLGGVRDLDVQRESLRESAGDLQAALKPFFTTLDERHETALAALREALESERLRALLDRLAEAARSPALTEDADKPCGRALPPLVAELWKKLRKGGRNLRPDSPDADFHAVRKRVKRARYAAEAAALALGARAAADAHQFARRAKDVQDVLGRHQDAVVACDMIEKFFKTRPKSNSLLFAGGRLLERQAQQACQARAEFFEVWEELDRKKLRAWLSE